MTRLTLDPAERALAVPAGLGRLAAAVAHEVNNELAIILFSSEELEDELKGASPRAAKLIARISETAVRVGNIMKGIQAFAEVGSGGRSPQAPADARLAFAEAQAFISRRYGKHGIEIDDSGLPGKFMVSVDREELTLVFLYLLVHSLDSLRESPASDGRRVLVSASQDEADAVIVVEHSGLAIPAAERARLFAPTMPLDPELPPRFLGLRAARALAAARGGDLALDPAADGRRFVARFPGGLQTLGARG